MKGNIYFQAYLFPAWYINPIRIIALLLLIEYLLTSKPIFYFYFLFSVGRVKFVLESIALLIEKR